MKQFLKRFLEKIASGMGIGQLAEEVAQIRQRLQRIELGTLDRQRLAHETTAANQLMQRLLTFHYQALARQRLPLPAFQDVEFRCFSQNGEDGILLYLFALLGTTNRKAVEVCAGDGIQCNTANLLINHGWTGLLFDGDEKNVRRGQEFYARCGDTFVWPPKLVQAWITAENIDELIRSHGFEGDIDLLSLDLDGVDYWIWKAIRCVRPRVVVVECHNIWGPDRAVTVPYRPDFRAEVGANGPDYAGASLPAFVKLAREKGYRLVGCQRYGFNAFFVRTGLGEDLLPEVTPARCLEHPQVAHGIKTRLPSVLDREWVEV